MRDVLSSMLEGCCASIMFCNDLLVDHCLETCCETSEERWDAILHHLFNGICVLQPDVPSCKVFGRGLTSTMHLSYEVSAPPLSDLVLRIVWTVDWLAPVHFRLDAVGL